MPEHRQNGAFTLIELLVVVTIIVILLSLLVPALDKAIAAAENAQCLGTLKLYGVAYRQYASDHNGDAIDIPGGSRSYWNYALAPYIGFKDYGKGDTTGAAEFMVCPSTEVTYPGNFAPDAHSTWNWDTAQGSYAFNLFFHSYVNYNPLLGYPASWWYLKFDKAPSNAPILGDGKWIGGWPTEFDPDPGNYDPGYNDNGGAYQQMARWCIDRHGNFTTNLGFADGSSSNMILGELWNVAWHRGTNPSYRSGGWD